MPKERKNKYVVKKEKRGGGLRHRARANLYHGNT